MNGTTVWSDLESIRCVWHGMLVITKVGHFSRADHHRIQREATHFSSSEQLNKSRDHELSKQVELLFTLLFVGDWLWFSCQCLARRGYAYVQLVLLGVLLLLWADGILVCVNSYFNFANRIRYKALSDMIRATVTVILYKLLLPTQRQNI